MDELNTMNTAHRNALGLVIVGMIAVGCTSILGGFDFEGSPASGGGGTSSTSGTGGSTSATGSGGTTSSTGGGGRRLLART